MIKISALPSASTLGGTEVVAGVQSGVTVKVLISQIGTYVRGLFTATPATIAEGGTGAANAGAARTALGLAIGTDVEAYDATILKTAAIGSTVQAYNANLASVAGLTLAAGDILVATGAVTAAVLHKGTAMQQLRMNTGATSAEWFTPATDDLVFGGGLYTSSSATGFLPYGLYQTTGLADGRNTDGTFTFGGGGAANGIWSLLEKAGGTYLTLFSAAKNPTIDIVAAQFGTGAGTRYMGLMNTAASPGTDGIYFRHANGGNIFAVARASGTEATVDTGIAASATLRRLKMVVTGGNSIDVQVDGVSKGTLSTNIPSVALGFYLDGGNVAVTDGIKASLIRVQQSR